MSLSSLLLASGPKKIDKELDDLFKSNPAPPRKPATPIHVPISGSAPPAKKRKIEAAAPEASPKRVKFAKPSKAAKASPNVGKSSSVKPTPKPTKKTKRKEVESVEENSEESGDDEDNSDLENAYLGKKRLTVKHSAASDGEGGEDEADSDNPLSENEDSDPDPDAPPPVHESLTKRVRTKPAKKSKIVPEGETSAQRDARTLFIGGLPIEVMQKKVMKKQLSRHILSFLPPSSKVKIESMRFRSVAFRDPTSSTALSSPTTAPGTSSVTANSVPVPASVNHSKARASTWRQSGAADEKEKPVDADGDSKKEYLTPAQKKKILFIQGAFHPEANGVNAYVVLAHHTLDSAEDTPAAAAAHIAHACNSSEFEGRTLSVDVCGRVAGATAGAAADGPVGDPKLSVFIGNLDFASREGDVREFFEGVVAGERGPAPEGEGRWVQGVRLIRDRETQLGKGFGYVRFVDRECVDEILALAKTDEGKTKLKFAKRTLRVQRCRVTGAASASKSTPATPTSKSTYPAAPPKRGDPTLGARLAHLDKDERKAVKKTDADRLARRAEKKKMGTRMRVGAVNDKIKAAVGGGGKRIGGGWKGAANDKGKGKDRERERKSRVSKNTGGFKGKK
ncbi:hypothetical protein C8R43DRAFT_1073140 [Mycena crocata]|nr:hypothetical protein C8R43DRAFT_1073140 [Mycena crocata]